MTPWRTFLELNRNIIFFGYGLVFFTMGVAIALQSRQSSRLELARSLKWMAFFGILHGLFEWTVLFLPIQSPNLSNRTIQIWDVIQLLLLALSFLSLMQFGIVTLPLDRYLRLLKFLPLGLFVCWSLLAIRLLPAGPDWEEWSNTANALARYFMGFPGALMAAFGLHYQARRRIAPLNIPRIVKTLEWASLMLGIYAILAGLFPPPVDFFPGNLVNRLTFYDFVGTPIYVFRSGLGFFLALSIVRALEIFDFESNQRIEAVERENMLAYERERIARELHDGTIQTLYTAGLLVESSANLAKPGSQLAQRLNGAVQAINDAIGDLRNTIGGLQVEHSSATLVEALQQLAAEPGFSSNVQITLQLDLDEAPILSWARMEHLLAIAHEALANVVKHARARSASVHACISGGQLELVIQDDGVGLPQNLSSGYGIRNMRDRARLLGGRLELASAETGKGTAVRLLVPWEEER